MLAKTQSQLKFLTSFVAESRDCSGVDGVTDFYEVVVAIDGGAAPYTLLVENAEGTILDMPTFMGGAATFNVQDNGAGYFITVQDAAGCTRLIDQLGIESCMTVDIELLSFDGEVSDEGNRLRWATATELNNAYFTLMHSVDGINFEAVAEINGAGTSSTLKQYEVLHEDAPAGTSYYQLVQTDYDGTSTTAPMTVTLTRKATQLAFVEVTTLFSDRLAVTFTNSQVGMVRAAIVDLSGRVITTDMVESNEGNTTFYMTLGHLPKGMYLLTLTNGEEVITTKLVKGN